MSVYSFIHEDLTLGNIFMLFVICTLTFATFSSANDDITLGGIAGGGGSGKTSHLKFIEPSKAYADIIVPHGGKNNAAIAFLTSKFNIRKEWAVATQCDNYFFNCTGFVIS